MLFVVLYPETLEGSTDSGSGFKASQKTGQRLKAPFSLSRFKVPVHPGLMIRDEP